MKPFHKYRQLILLPPLLCIFHFAAAQRNHYKAVRVLTAAQFDTAAIPFPFSNAKKILLISFTEPSMDPGIRTPGDTTPVHTPVRYGRFADTLGYADVREIAEASPREIIQLNNLFYRQQCNGPEYELGCYNPRNAVLFIGDSGKLIARLEVCFTCSVCVTRPAEFKVSIRGCKYDILKAIFRDAGIAYGIPGKNPLH